MSDADWTREQAEISLGRLLPQLRRAWNTPDADPHLWDAFEQRLCREWEQLFGLLIQIYGQHYDLFYHFEQLLHAAAQSWFERPAALRELDAQREAHPDWYLSQRLVGGMLYVDLFSDDLAGLHKRIPYLKQLGINYLHLMPIFDAPAEDSDGGYAVSNYRAVNPDIGTMAQLTELAALLREDGISLVLDFVFNHTSDEHEWALQAQAGDQTYQRYYLTFPDRTLPDQYDRTLREIFPATRTGSFTWNKPMQRWIWTTFNSFQWDLNYANPDVFRAMAGEMLFLANCGVEVLRLDAVAFVWKQIGTTSENLPQAHTIIRAFNALARIAAPGLVFKSEAIVHPDDVVKYIGLQEAQLSYNPLLMALLWEALASREVKLLAHSLHKRFVIPQGCTWINYLRCHDDIGWTFDDDDARMLGIDPAGHRRFLNQFYTGEFSGSFARGLQFQYNPATGDARVTGTLASLAGLEQAVYEENTLLVELAVKRILMLHSVILSVGGIPLIYLGDEIAQLNDYSYVDDPAKAIDSRWVHRLHADWEHVGRWNDMGEPSGYVFNELLRLVALRKGQAALWGADLAVIDTGNPHMLGYVRQHAGQRLLIIVNFSEYAQQTSGNHLRVNGVGYRFTDLNTGLSFSAAEQFRLEPYQFVWLEVQSDG